MTTCIFYVDESGDPKRHHIPLKNGQSPIFTLGAIALPVDAWRDFDRQFLRLKRHYFPDWLSNSSKRDEYYEIKGNDLTAPRSSNSSRKHAYLKAVLNFIRTHGGGNCCFGITILKNGRKPTLENTVYTISLQYLAERLNLYIDEHPKYDKGIIICDSRKGMGIKRDVDVAKSYMSYIFGHRTGKTLTNLVEAPMFADSRVTSGLQLSDNFVSVLRTTQYIHNLGNIPGGSDYGHMQNYWSIINGMEFKSKTMECFGYRTIDFRDK
ncbi:MAG: DUF3800 domain-containing protein [Desulfatibacillaceae bacterium]